MSQNSIMASGTFEGTGSAKNIEIGWQPDFVICFNIDAATPIFHCWTSDMADGTSMDVAAAAANNAAGAITPYAGSDTAGSEVSAGFTAGTDISVSAETICWVAFRAQR